MSNKRAAWLWLAWGLAGLTLALAGVLSTTLSPTPVTWAQAPAVQTCTELLANGGFETDAAWERPVTAYRSVYSSEQVYTGTHSLRAGIVDPADNVLSYSSAFQAVQLPTGAQTLTLSLWLYPVSTEGDLEPEASMVEDITLQAVAAGVAPAPSLTGDRQYVLLTNEQNTVLARLLWTRSDAQSWQPVTFDLTAYAGNTVRLHVGVYNDGAAGITALYVDEASLVDCPSHAAEGYLPLIHADTVTATPTVTPTVISPPTSTPTSTVVWTDPSQAIEVFSPVPDGLYHSPIQVYGFSQTFEGNVNLRLTDHTGQVLAERSTIGGSTDGFAFFDSYLRFTVQSPISATLEVLETSAKDGSELHKVTIPVMLLPGQRVIDLTMPTVGMSVCNPVLVAGYSNTFEATVVVTLNSRDGGELAQATAMGGNLGIYADFATIISHTIASPQPVLVAAFEESAAGLGLIDQTRVPVALYPSGTTACP